MTGLQYILTLLLIGTTCQLSGQRKIKDTTFFFKDTVDGQQQSIFIDNDRSSQLYVAIAYFEFLEFDSASYKSSIDYLKEQKLTFIKAKPVIPWTRWVTLGQYKGKFYVYHPCDFLFHFRQSVNDSSFIDWTGEGPVANKIISQKKIDSRTYEFKLTGVYQQNRTVRIHIIDIKRGIAVFEETNETGRRYDLMIAAEKIKTVPIIVNHCPIQKQSEFEFDKPNFKILLKAK